MSRMRLDVRKGLSYYGDNRVIIVRGLIAALDYYLGVGLV